MCLDILVDNILICTSLSRRWYFCALVPLPGVTWTWPTKMPGPVTTEYLSCYRFTGLGTENEPAYLVGSSRKVVYQDLQILLSSELSSSLSIYSCMCAVYGPVILDVVYLRFLESRVLRTHQAVILSPPCKVHTHYHYVSVSPRGLTLYPAKVPRT